MNEFWIALGARLREHRESARMTQTRLGELTGIVRPNIARIESGRNALTLETIERVCRALGVEPAELLGEIYGRGLRVSDLPKEAA